MCLGIANQLAEVRDGERGVHNKLHRAARNECDRREVAALVVRTLAELMRQQSEGRPNAVKKRMAVRQRGGDGLVTDDGSAARAVLHDDGDIERLAEPLRYDASRGVGC